MGAKLGKFKKTKIEKNYKLGEKLGTGSFAVVKKATRKKDGQEVAVKIIKKKNLALSELETIKDEVDIMTRVKHDNVVQLIEIFDSPKSLHMVLELCAGGELFERIVSQEGVKKITTPARALCFKLNGHFSERQASNLVRDLASAINYLHGQGIVHRDLKPENLIYSNDDVLKISDFGLAKHLQSSGQTMSTACGTPGYVAPEILKGEPYGKEVDLWSLGVILYILLCGFPPFYAENAAGLYAQIKRAKYDFPEPYWTDVSEEAKDLISKLMVVDPKKRLTCTGILEHPWIRSDDVSDKPLGDAFAQRLAQFNARRKFRRGIQMILALNMLTRAIAEGDEDTEDNGEVREKVDSVGARGESIAASK